MQGAQVTGRQDSDRGHSDFRVASRTTDRPGRNGAHPTQAELERLRIIVADPDPLARRAIRDSLQLDGAFVISAEAKDGLEAVELAVHYRPDLMLMEVALPTLDGVAACREVRTRAPEVRVVMFSVPQSREIEIRALRAGAV